MNLKQVYYQKNYIKLLNENNKFNKKINLIILMHYS